MEFSRKFFIKLKLHFYLTLHFPSNSLLIVNFWIYLLVTIMVKLKFIALLLSFVAVINVLLSFLRRQESIGLLILYFSLSLRRGARGEVICIFTIKKSPFILWARVGKLSFFFFFFSFFLFLFVYEYF